MADGMPENGPEMAFRRVKSAFFLNNKESFGFSDCIFREFVVYFFLNFYRPLTFGEHT